MSDEKPNADERFSELPAPSRQKAMDWSLVLASQDIPHLIASPDESGRWTLRVASADLPRASASIRQYEAENKTRPWQQPYWEGRIIFDWLALVWAAALIAMHAASESFPGIHTAGVMRGLDVSAGQWWRLVTATQLHADWGHLASNLSLGVVLLGLVMGRWGTGVGMLAALLAGVFGNLGNWIAQPAQLSLGASGVVMGCIGLLALQPGRPDKAAKFVWRGVLASTGGAALLFMLLGLDPRSDVLAHAGGFLGGLALAGVLRGYPKLSRNRRANTLATLAMTGLVFAAWISAATMPARQGKTAPFKNTVPNTETAIPTHFPQFQAVFVQSGACHGSCYLQSKQSELEHEKRTI